MAAPSHAGTISNHARAWYGGARQLRPYINHEKRPGAFVCAGCGQRLFVSAKKFESGTGWPSFNNPLEGAVEGAEDRSHGIARTEVHCKPLRQPFGPRLSGGPPPTYLRYCINGAAMNFLPD